MNDLTRLLQTLQPTPDGESAVRHRTALVDAVNADGTVDLDFDGTIIPDVSVLDGVVAGVGDVVQIAAWAGDLLVLGRTRPSDTGGPRGLIEFDTKTANQTGITAEADVTGLTATWTAEAGRAYKLTCFLRLNQLTNNATVTSRITDGANNSIIAANQTVLVNAVENITLVGVVVPGAGSVTYKARASATAASLTILGGATAPCWFIAEDIGLA